MKQFIEYFNEDEIIAYLCKQRVKLAKQRSKKHLIHLLTKDKKYNYHNPKPEDVSAFDKQFQEELYDLLPSRKQWKELGEGSRYKTNKNGVKQKVISVDKNIFSILKTIKYYKKNNPNEQFLLNLNSFISNVQELVLNRTFQFDTPSIYPQPKKLIKQKDLKINETNICRPIAQFKLLDRLILSFTNKFFTQIFDKYFNECSLAFRSVTKDNLVINHHTGIDKIKEYKTKYINEDLWVAECDMKKFYDSVSHDIVIDKFNKLIAKVKADNPLLDLIHPSHLFNQYLKCYSFNTNAIALNENSDYWKQHKIPSGEFGWVLNEIKAFKFYNRMPLFFWNVLKSLKNTRIYNYLDISFCKINSSRIGIPQGGALSGLIANIVLDYTDKKTLEKSDVFYIRFCDDMILMHPDKNVCSKAIDRYTKSLFKLKLVPHQFAENLVEERKAIKPHLPKLTLAKFWNAKSKGPYLWGVFNAKNTSPWIGFVGYELHHSLATRIRKTSLFKEIEKQQRTVNLIKKVTVYNKEKQRKRNKTAEESAINRLVGMSVGRVELWNYSKVISEMCWKEGFEKIEANKHSIKQLKQLDRSRNKLFKDLRKSLNATVDKAPPENNPNREIIIYGKPYSYYYHFVEKK